MARRSLAKSLSSLARIPSDIGLGFELDRHVNGLCGSDANGCKKEIRVSQANTAPCVQSVWCAMVRSWGSVVLSRDLFKYCASNTEPAISTMTILFARVPLGAICHGQVSCIRA